MTWREGRGEVVVVVMVGGVCEGRWCSEEGGKEEEEEKNKK
jgi:hypothetical protein